MLPPLKGCGLPASRNTRWILGQAFSRRCPRLLRICTNPVRLYVQQENADARYTTSMPTGLRLKPVKVDTDINVKLAFIPRLKPVGFPARSAKKTKCLFQDAPTIDINSCRRVKQIIDALGKKYKSKQEQDIILQAFITAVNVYFDQFIEEVGRNPRYFRYMVGKWLQEKCRKDIACPFKPLLPETL